MPRGAALAVITKGSWGNLAVLLRDLASLELFPSNETAYSRLRAGLPVGAEALPIKVVCVGPGHTEGIAMSKTTGIPVKTRLPLTAWVLAGLVTLFSLVSALVHVTTTIPELTVSVADQKTPKAAHRADANGVGPRS